MKSSFLGISLVFLCCCPSYTQSTDLADYYFTRNDLGNAMSTIRKAIKGPDANDARTWLLMYHIFKKAETTSPYNAYPDAALSEAYDAIANLIKLPYGNWAMESEFGKEYLQIFNKFYSEFVIYGNKHVDLEHYGEAFKNYKKALEVYNNIYKYGLDPSPLDTALTFHVGLNALKAGKYAETEKYFLILANANYHHPEAGLLYTWLVKYYITATKDIAQAKSIYQKGIQYYPNEKEWTEIRPSIESTQRE